MVHREQRRVVVRDGWDLGAPVFSSASRIASARAGTSVAGVNVPIQISACGSCRRQSSLQTNGSIRVAPCHGRAKTASSSGRSSRPTELDRRRRGHGRPRHGRAHRRDRRRPALAPASGRHRRAQRGGRVDRLARDPGTGLLETPVYLTSTHAVGRVYDGAVSVAMAADPRVGVDDVVIPVVGECDDSWLSDARVSHVQPDDVGRAVADATPDFEQGAVGAGAG